MNAPAATCMILKQVILTTALRRAPLSRTCRTTGSAPSAVRKKSIFFLPTDLSSPCPTLLGFAQTGPGLFLRLQIPQIPSASPYPRRLPRSCFPYLVSSGSLPSKISTISGPGGNGILLEWWKGHYDKTRFRSRRRQSSNSPSLTVCVAKIRISWKSGPSLSTNETVRPGWATRGLQADDRLHPRAVLYGRDALGKRGSKHDLCCPMLCTESRIGM